MSTYRFPSQMKSKPQRREYWKHKKIKAQRKGQSGNRSFFKGLGWLTLDEVMRL